MISHLAFAEFYIFIFSFWKEREEKGHMIVTLVAYNSINLWQISEEKNTSFSKLTWRLISLCVKISVDTQTTRQLGQIQRKTQSNQLVDWIDHSRGEASINLVWTKWHGLNVFQQMTLKLGKHMWVIFAESSNKASKIFACCWDPTSFLSIEI